MNSPSILIISGTNRPGSNAMKIARIVLGHYQAAKINAELFSLTDLPPEMFAPSAYVTKPASVAAIQQRILDACGLHVISPEYNGSFPGVLKYFIDMLKFPESFEHKPVAFVGESMGVYGALRPVEHLQAIFSYRNAHIFPERVFIPGVAGKLDAEGKLTDPSIDQRLAKQVIDFKQFISRISPQ